MCAYATANASQGVLPCRRCILALAVGFVFRGKGGMALQAMLPVSVNTIIALARASPEATRQPYLHSLWLIATSAGLAFVPHVRVSHACPIDSRQPLLACHRHHHCCWSSALGTASCTAAPADAWTHLQGTLQLALEALMWPPLATGGGLRAAVGRLANALVAVLGPELVPGSQAYTQTKLIIREMQVLLVRWRKYASPDLRLLVCCMQLLTASHCAVY